MQVESYASNIISIIKQRKLEKDIFYKHVLEALSDNIFLNFLPERLISLLNNLSYNQHLIESNSQHTYILQLKEIPLLYQGFRAAKIKNADEYESKYSEFEGKMNDADARLKLIKDTAEHINGATALTAYAKKFSEQSETHKKSADRWKCAIVFGCIIFGLFSGLALFLNLSEYAIIKDKLPTDIKTLAYASLSIKFGILFIMYSIIRFLNRNYYAEKHLQQLYKNRSNIMDTLHSVYESISSTNEKDKILAIGAISAFERGETGYITTKEGAGSDDSLIQTILSKIK